MYRINELIKIDRKLYHTNDLAVLWDIANKNTLYTTISRYVKKGVLIPVYKGLYSTIPLNEINPLELGRAIIHRYTYLSTESVLSQSGIISQVIYPYTFVSEQPRKVSIGALFYLYRKMKPQYLFNPAGIIDDHGIAVASPERAVADMLYYNPSYYFDHHEKIDYKKVNAIQKEVGYS